MRKWLITDLFWALNIKFCYFETITNNLSNTWNCFGLQVGISVCVSALRALINRGVTWCDIGRMRLVKQALWLFPAVNYFIWHLPSIKGMGMPILTQLIVNTCQRKLKWHGTSYKRTTEKTEHFNYKSEWAYAYRCI